MFHFGKETIFQRIFSSITQNNNKEQTLSSKVKNKKIKSLKFELSTVIVSFSTGKYTKNDEIYCKIDKFLMMLFN